MSVHGTAQKRLVVAWALVVAVTLIYVVIDGSTDHDGILRAGAGTSIAAIVLSLAKLRIIMREFMDVRHAPRVLRTMTDALVVVMGVSLLGTYLAGRAIG